MPSAEALEDSGIARLPGAKEGLALNGTCMAGGRLALLAPSAEIADLASLRRRIAWYAVAFDARIHTASLTLKKQSAAHLWICGQRTANALERRSTRAGRLPPALYAQVHGLLVWL
jgi:hypothetical protein